MFVAIGPPIFTQKKKMFSTLRWKKIVRKIEAIAICFFGKNKFGFHSENQPIYYNFFHGSSNLNMRQHFFAQS